jgi:hypothetical protein
MYWLLKQWGMLSEQELNTPHFAHPKFSQQVRELSLNVKLLLTVCLFQTQFS